MSWRFRTSFKVMPGLRLNLSRTGLSATVGASPFSMNVGPRGVYGTASIPGTGISHRQRLDASTSPPNLESVDQVPYARPQIPQVPTHLGEVFEIRSASTEMLRSQSMADLQNLLEETFRERTDLQDEVRGASRESWSATERYRSWDNGFLFKRLFKESFAKRKEVFETAQAKLAELEEQLRLTTLATHIDIDPEQAEPYFRMRDAFSSLTESQKIWDTLDRRLVDRFGTRSAAWQSINRDEVSFALGACDLIQWEKPVLHMPNKTGGDLFIYPGFALYRAAKRSFAIIDTREIRLKFTRQQFIEEKAVPSDSRTVGHAWAKSNKDGSPDRRFRDNYQIPIALYGSLTFTSPSGLHEEFLASDAERADRFSHAWDSFQNSFLSNTVASVGQDARSRLRRVPKSVPDTPREIAESAPADVTTAFATESEKARALVAGRGELWEYELTEELLRPRINRLLEACGKIDEQVASCRKKKLTRERCAAWMVEEFEKLTALVKLMPPIIEGELQGSWGKPGEAGDPIRILRAVDVLISGCGRFIEWEIELRSFAPPTPFVPVITAFQGIARSALGNIIAFPDELNRVVAGARAGVVNHRINLAFVTPPQIDRATAAFEMASRA